jgi:hypothetical protein
MEMTINVCSHKNTGGADEKMKTRTDGGGDTCEGKRKPGKPMSTERPCNAQKAVSDSPHGCLTQWLSRVSREGWLCLA